MAPVVDDRRRRVPTAQVHREVLAKSDPSRIGRHRRDSAATSLLSADGGRCTVCLALELRSGDQVGTPAQRLTVDAGAQVIASIACLAPICTC